MSLRNISAGITAAVFALIPFASEAYFTTQQNATALGDTAALYTIEYAFGLEDYDIYMPIIATRGLAYESDEKKVGYSFRENGEEVKENGTAAALVVSNAPIVDGMYKIAKGTAVKMTLLAILVTDATTEESDYALQVDRLPYYIDRGDDGLESLALNPSELQYYVTKEVELNTGNYK